MTFSQSRDCDSWRIEEHPEASGVPSSVALTPCS